MEGTRHIRGLGRSRGRGIPARALGAIGTFRGRGSLEAEQPKSSRGRGSRKRGLTGDPLADPLKTSYVDYSDLSPVAFSHHSIFNSNSAFGFLDEPDTRAPSVYYSNSIWDRKDEPTFDSTPHPKPKYSFREVIDPETNKWVYGRIEASVNGRYHLELVKSNCVELPFVWAWRHETADPGTHLSLSYCEFLEASLRPRAASGFHKRSPSASTSPRTVSSHSEPPTSSTRLSSHSEPTTPARRMPDTKAKNKPPKKRPTSIERQKENYKTELCKFWAEGKICRFRKKCIFAHGHHELRTKEQNRLEYGLKSK